MEVSGHELIMKLSNKKRTWYQSTKCVAKIL